MKYGMCFSVKLKPSVIVVKVVICRAIASYQVLMLVLVGLLVGWQAGRLAGR